MHVLFQGLWSKYRIIYPGLSTIVLCMFYSRGYGLNGTAVMHTVYVDGACAETWRDVAQLKTDYIDFEIHKALEAKYEVKVPEPIDTEYQYWESAW